MQATRRRKEKAKKERARTAKQEKKLRKESAKKGNAATAKAGAA
jgi:hypothetical protein